MVKAIASAMVDVFTSLIGLLIAGAVVVLAAVALAGAFGLGGFALHRRRRRKR